MLETLSNCDHCGAVFPASDMHPLHRIEETIIDLKAGVEPHRPTGRGRTPWIAPRRHDPMVLVRTPRYAYIRASYTVCEACLACAETDERNLHLFHRRGTLTVALTAMVLGAVLLSVWIMWPGAYAGLGLVRPAPQPYAGAPPPSTKPYKPPFSADTPVAP